MRWLNEPSVWSGDASDLTVAVEPETDFWRTTHYGFVRDNGHFAHTGVMALRVMPRPLSSGRRHT